MSERGTTKKKTLAADFSLVDGDVGVGQFHYGWDFTEEMVQLVSPTKGKCHGQCCMYHRIAKACNPSSYNQLQAKLWMYDHHVVEWVANSCIAVISHHSQEDTLHSPKSHSHHR
jgi:hypothetical protein